jgi:hypothetical protein
MKSKMLIFSFIAFFVGACGPSEPSPSTDIYSIHPAFSEFKKSEEYQEYWKVMGILKKYRKALSDKNYIKENHNRIDNWITAMGVDAVDCYKKLLFSVKPNNWKVINHFQLRKALYERTGHFWAEDWIKYRNGESDLPNIVQLVDEIFKEKDYLDNQYFELRSET